jgi:four helix bundle protein
MDRAVIPGVNRSELEVRCATFAVQVVELCKDVRTRPGGRNHADQLSDAATSVASNYRATSRSRSDKEFAAKIGVVAEEADEAVYWLELVTKTSFCDAAKGKGLLAEAKELRNIFAASYKTARRNLAKKRPRSPDSNQ